MTVFVAPQQANAIRAVNSTDSHRADAASSPLPLEDPDLDYAAGLHHFITS